MKILFADSFRPLSDHDEIVALHYTSSNVIRWKKHMRCVRESLLVSNAACRYALQQEKGDHEKTRALYALDKDAWKKERELMLHIIDQRGTAVTTL
jgi:hypothetical protein